MAVARTYKQVTKVTTTEHNSYPAVFREFIDMIQEASDKFTIFQTVADTATSYDVVIRYGTTPLAVRLSHSTSSGGSLYFRPGAIVDGAFVPTVDQDNVSLGGMGAGITLTVTYQDIGGFMANLVLHNTSMEHGLSIKFGTALSEYLDKTVYFLAVDDYNTYDPLTFSQTYVYNDDGSVLASGTCTFTSDAHTTAALSPTGATAVLNPYAYIGYVGTRCWLGKLLWGGQYDLYMLYNAAGIYPASPTAEYTIDGTVYKGVFNKLIVPVESA